MHLFKRRKKTNQKQGFYYLEPITIIMCADPTIEEFWKNASTGVKGHLAGSSIQKASLLTLYIFMEGGQFQKIFMGSHLAFSSITQRCFLVPTVPINSNANKILYK